MMEKKLKVMTILGTRPEIIRLAMTIRALDKYFDHILVHTGQNYDYELNEIFFNQLELRKPDYYLSAVGKDLGETMGLIIAKSYEVIKKEKPDALLVLGDTNSALSAIAAKRLKVPIFHMEAGNRCWDWNVPEMVNRTIVDHISDINLPYTENSRRYLLSEGMNGKTIFVTGSPMYEVLNYHKDKIEISRAMQYLNLKKNQYILVSAHREENIDNEKHFMSLMNAINAVAEHYNMPIIYSCHPRSRHIIEQRHFKFHPLVKELKPFGLFDYCSLQKNAFVVLSDSGTLTEESAMLGFKAVLIRTSTERPEGLDQGSIILGQIDEKHILNAIDIATKAPLTSNLVNEYKVDNVSERVAKIILSYTPIVRLTMHYDE